MEEARRRAALWATSPTESSLCRYLDTPCFRGTFIASTYNLLQQTVLMAGWWVAAARLPLLPCCQSILNTIVGCLALAFAWGLLVLRSYMIFHDAGHGSFYQGFRGAKILNWLTLQLSAIMCGTPTDWNVGHQLHHANIGNLGQNDYDWGETIFHTGAQYLRLPTWRQKMWKVSSSAHTAQP